MKRSKKWLGKKLDYVCYISGVHQWANHDGCTIIITETQSKHIANMPYVAEVTLNCDIDTIYSPCFKTERAARKYVERKLEELHCETTQLLGKDELWK